VKFILILGLIFILANHPVLTGPEAEQEIYVFNDESDDDYGPGSYSYPLHDDFAPREGLFDIRKMKIVEAEQDYIFTFSFGRINNPWNKSGGFSHPLIEVYIDNQEGGISGSFQDSARVDFKKSHPWNHLLKISGEFIRVFQPEDEKKVEKIEILEDDVLDSPWDVNEYELKVEDNEIVLRLGKDLLGPIAGSYMYILVGSFDPLGPGYYREVTNNRSHWYIYDTELEEKLIEQAPRVMDIILPENKDQKEVLSNFNSEQYAVAAPIQVLSYAERMRQKTPEREEIIRLLVLPLVIIFILITGYTFRSDFGR